MPGLVSQCRHQRRQHRVVAGKAQRADGRAAHLGVRLGLGERCQRQQRRLVLEPAKNAHCLTPHGGVVIGQRQQRRVGGILQAQLAQGSQGTGADEGIGVFDPWQDQLAGLKALEFAEALCSCQAYRLGGIGQRSAQGLHNFGFFPGLKQARGLGTHLVGGVHQQGIGEPRQAIRVFQVGQLDQGDAAHASVGGIKARQQGKDVGVVGRSVSHSAIRSGGWSVSGRPSGVRRGSSRPSSWRSNARQ